MFIDDKTRISHMIEAAEEAVAFARNRSIDDIRADRALALALVKCLEMVGEASFKTSRNFRDDHADIPWRVMIDLRNHLVHEYHDIDIERVWITIQKDLPSILPSLKTLRSGLDDPSV